MKVKNARKLDVRKGHVTQCCFCKESIFLDMEEPVYIRTRRRTEVWAHKECYRKTQKTN